MKGFKNANIASKSKLDRLTGMMVMYPVDPREENEMMEKAGFTIDRENSIYVREGFGAFRCNVDKKIKTIDDLRSYEENGTNPYSEILRLIDEEGYEFVLGPGAPNGLLGDLGLYCKNYKEIIEKEKATTTKKSAKEEQWEK